MRKNFPNVEIVKSIPKEEFEEYIKSGMTRKNIADKFGVSKGTIDNIFKDLGIHKDQLFNINKFDTIDSEEKAYWLGFLYADGSVMNSNKNNCIKLCLAEKDKNHVIKFKNFMEDIRDDDSCLQYRKIKLKYSGDKEFGSYKYVAYNMHLVESLIRLGCTPRKSLTLKFPDISIFSDPDLVYDFIRGYVDGDGCISFAGKYKDKISISIVGTVDFLNGIREYFPQFNHVMKGGANFYCISCSHIKAEEITYRLYENASIYLDRKYERYAALCRLHNSETLDKIGESCDANAEVTSEIAKGSESTVENSE